MKELILALKDSIDSRVKNKVIASILVSWFLWNWKGVAIFTLSSKIEMIDIIRRYQFDIFDDALYPIAIGIIYLTVMQFFIYMPAHVADLISIKISKISSFNARKKLELQRRLNRAAILSDYEYQKTMKIKKLEDASVRLIEIEKNFSLCESNLENMRNAKIESDRVIKILNEKLTNIEMEAANKKSKVAIYLSQIKDSVQYTLQILDSAKKSEENKAELIRRATIVLSDALRRLPETEQLRPNQTESANRRWDLLPTE
ncbi:hypothetical protein [Aeromonas veronii]|uniref:hypothetical protein n=1 Tax=Aeromonas veronii TaxID=654 RepID=UPI001116BCC7|nr:hypothetical protein [Aeromonas veronii]